uniref:Uncharacterized protein n=1 Tax=Arundo donax TaxID=35708 RepID=A0A0A9FWW0_ARUDO
MFLQTGEDGPRIHACKYLFFNFTAYGGIVQHGGDRMSFSTSPLALEGIEARF